MTVTKLLAKHFRDVYFGGNWTCSNLRDNLKDISWQQATVQVYTYNTIATLTFHIQYYVDAVIKVFQGEALNAKDEYSFAHPPFHSQAEWDSFLDKLWADAETFAALIEQLPDEKLWEDFTDAKYGSYYRNIQGIIEHTHYHLGQIALVRKKLLSKD